eukprot:899819_1
MTEQESKSNDNDSNETITSNKVLTKLSTMINVLEDTKDRQETKETVDSSVDKSTNFQQEFQTMKNTITSQAKRIEQIESENATLAKLVSDLNIKLSTLEQRVDRIATEKK